MPCYAAETALAGPEAEGMVWRPVLPEWFGFSKSQYGSGHGKLLFARVRRGGSARACRGGSVEPVTRMTLTGKMAGLKAVFGVVGGSGMRCVAPVAAPPPQAPRMAGHVCGIAQPATRRGVSRPAMTLHRFRRRISRPSHGSPLLSRMQDAKTVPSEICSVMHGIGCAHQVRVDRGLLALHRVHEPHQLRFALRQHLPATPLPRISRAPVALAQPSSNISPPCATLIHVRKSHPLRLRQGNSVPRRYPSKRQLIRRQRE
jgi:hypothetical protein